MGVGASHLNSPFALLSIHLRGSHQNVIIAANTSSPLMGKSLQYLGENYLVQLPSSGGGNECDGGHVVQASGPAFSPSKLEFEVGVSCCPNPKEADLIKTWNRHKKSLLDLLGNLQGIHLNVANTGAEIKVRMIFRILLLGYYR